MGEFIDLDGKKIDIYQAIDLAVKYQRGIDSIGVQLRDICYKQIIPLLEEDKYNKAKKYVNRFFKTEDVEDIFIEKDLLLAHINRLKAKENNQK